MALIAVLVAAVIIADGAALYAYFRPSQVHHIEIVDYTHHYDTMVPGMRVVAFTVNLTNPGPDVETVTIVCTLGTHNCLYTAASMPFSMNPATNATYGSYIAIPIYDTTQIVGLWCEITPHEAQ